MREINIGICGEVRIMTADLKDFLYHIFSAAICISDSSACRRILGDRNLCRAIDLRHHHICVYELYPCVR